MSGSKAIACAIAAAAVLALGILNFAQGQAQTAPAAGAKVAKCDRAKFGLLLDVGHTPEEPGAVSARGANEYDFNLRLAQRIEKTLVDAGFRRTVLQATGGPAITGLVHRVAAANKANVDLFLSIHHDSVPDRFLETWEYDGKEMHYCDRFKGHSIFVSFENGHRNASLRFARLLGKQLKDRGLQYTPHYTEAFMRERRRELLDADVGVYRFDQLYVLRATAMPAVLLEAGSIINRDEELQLAGDERQSQIAASVLDAVDDFCAGRATKADVTERAR
ncbi:MAG TPA: N-acetylmuramoyl-L-alanine amidase [Xanthobacteraceae bacterium]|nr:N-acetylmuramoyl-L-alanine amidase [Xanthobacteraceae bacterium]